MQHGTVCTGIVRQTYVDNNPALMPIKRLESGSGFLYPTMH
jgi:hypothetical protein